MILFIILSFFQLLYGGKRFQQLDWIILDRNLAPVPETIRKREAYKLNQTQYFYESIEGKNITFKFTNIKRGFQEIKVSIIFDISEAYDMETPLKIINEVNQVYDKIRCYKVQSFQSQYFCEFTSIPQQQQFITIILVQTSDFQYTIINAQLIVYSCDPNCLQCKLSHKDECYCEKCNENYAITNKLGHCSLIKNLQHECINFNHLQDNIQSCRDYIISDESFCDSHFQSELYSIDGEILNRQHEIDGKYVIGPFQQLEGFTKIINYSGKINKKIDLEIKFNVYFLSNEVIRSLGSTVAVYFNNFNIKYLIQGSFQQEERFQNCQSRLYLFCQTHEEVILIKQIQQIDNLTFYGYLKVQDFNNAWCISNISISEIRFLACKKYIYHNYCVDECPILTKLNVLKECEDIIRDKFIIPIYTFFDSSIQHLELNFQYNYLLYQQTPQISSYEFQSNFYYPFLGQISYISRSLGGQGKLHKIFLKLLILNTFKDVKIEIKIQNQIFSYDEKQFLKLDQSSNDLDLNDYYLEINELEFKIKSFEWKISIQSNYPNQILAISQLVEYSIECKEMSFPCNTQNQITNESNLCNNGFFYTNFNCYKCNISNCQCKNGISCSSCSGNFTLFNDQCYIINQNIYSYILFQFQQPYLSHYTETYCQNASEIIQNGFCDCRNGYYHDHQQKICLQCDSMCFTCIENPNYCNSCQEDDYRILQSHQCVCKQGYYDLKNQSKCLQCSNNCKACSFNFNVCTECYAEQNRILVNSLCHCKDGFYLDVIVDICKECSKTCKKCNLEELCVECYETDYRILTFQNQCFCKSGYFENQDSQVCGKCHYSCEECESDQFNKCTQCPKNRIQTNKYLNYFECKCIVGFYDKGTQECLNCKYLENPDFDHYCYSKCGDGIIQWQEDCDSGNETKRTDCYKCRFTQSKCNPDNCLKCVNQKCELCKDGFYLTEDFSCKSCSLQCQSCSRSASNCILCSTIDKQCKFCEEIEGYQLINQQCQPICGDGYLVSGEQCDDGNIIDHDGCSKLCNVDQGFICGNICEKQDKEMNLILQQQQSWSDFQNQIFLLIIQNSPTIILPKQLQIYLNYGAFEIQIENENIQEIDKKKDEQKFLLYLKKNFIHYNQTITVLLQDFQVSTSKAFINYSYLEKSFLKQIMDIAIIISTYLTYFLIFTMMVNYFTLPRKSYALIFGVFCQYSYLRYLNINFPNHTNQFFNQFRVFEIYTFFGSKEVIYYKQSNLYDLLESQGYFNILTIFLFILLNIFISGISYYIKEMVYKRRKNLFLMSFKLQHLQGARLIYLISFFNLIFFANLFLNYQSYCISFCVPILAIFLFYQINIYRLQHITFKLTLLDSCFCISIIYLREFVIAQIIFLSIIVTTKLVLSWFQYKKSFRFKIKKQQVFKLYLLVLLIQWVNLLTILVFYYSNNCESRYLIQQRIFEALLLYLNLALQIAVLWPYWKLFWVITKSNCREKSHFQFKSEQNI